MIYCLVDYTIKWFFRLFEGRRSILRFRSGWRPYVISTFSGEICLFCAKVYEVAMPL